MTRRIEIDSNQNRWMCFVDGENMTMRGQAVAKEHDIPLIEGPWYRRDVFLWFPDHSLVRVFQNTAQFSLITYPRSLLLLHECNCR